MCDRDDVLPVLIRISNVIHGLFDHIDPQPADLPLLSGRRHIRILMLERVECDPAVDKGDAHFARAAPLHQQAEGEGSG